LEVALTGKARVSDMVRIFSEAKDEQMTSVAKMIHQISKEKTGCLRNWFQTKFKLLLAFIK
jgi:hypothetical protein